MSPARKKTGFIATIPEWVAQQYYRHGLFCASQPLPVLIFAIIGILWACFPLLTIQFYSGNAKVWTEDPTDTAQYSEKPRWLDKQPIGYVQQVIMKAAVHPYTEDMLLNDAFRGPLASSFKLHLSDILGFFDKETGLDMDHECLRTDGLSPRYRASLAHILPDYGCLILSPANIWRKDPVQFQEDGDPVNTIFKFQSSREGHSSLADIMFGLRQRDTGLTKYPVRNRQRIITYSVTVVLRQHKPQFIKTLRRHLSQLYPLHVDENNRTESIVHIHFPEQISGTEYIPYTVLIIGLFLYMLFSCRKIDLIQSKVGIALTAVITILGSLFMSLGLTGQSLGGTGYVYLVPYAVAFIELENILVITRSIVSTPAHLDVKVRVAQGLSREGWNITKNLFSQITLLTLGFFLGILDHSIQEFSIFAVMGLLSDFYLQHFFYITVLSMDISRTGLVDVLQIQRSHHKRSVSQASSTGYSNKLFQLPVSGPGGRYETEGSAGTGLIAPSLDIPPKKVPKRVQIVNFWATRRVVSRIFLLTMVGWIAIFIYKAGILEYIIKGAGFIPKDRAPTIDIPNLNTTSQRSRPRPRPEKGGVENISTILASMRSQASETDQDNPATGGRGARTEYLSRLQHRTSEYWRRLPYSHWPMLFGLYNMSVFGSHLSLLPPISLSMVISPEAVVQLRSPHEQTQKLKGSGEEETVWNLEKIKVALEMGDEEEDLDDLTDEGPELSPFVPTSPGELLLAFTLSIPSILFLIYLCVVCYRFICTKNYAEWRSGRLDTSEDKYTQIVQEGAPIPLDGHDQEIESVRCDGHLVVSHCMGGRICVWDSLTGEALVKIRRGETREVSKEKMEEIPEPGSGQSRWNRELPVSLRFRNKGSKNPSTTFNQFQSAFKSTRATAKEGIKKQDQEGGKVRKGSEDTKQKKHKEKEGGEIESVWCLDLAEGLVVLGCNSGRIEVWNAVTGELCCSYEDGRRVPINIIRLLNSRLVAVRLDGHIDFMDLNSNPGLSAAGSNYSRLRTLSTNSLDTDSIYSLGESVSLTWKHTVKAHIQSITCVAVAGSRLITGSEDHTLRVFRVEDGVGVYTLHGHCGPITSVFIDRFNQSAAGSASQDGIICMWDLLTGACMYSIQAHDGSVLCLVYSPSYVVSYGQDGKLCVWERFQGHLINTINTAVLGEQSCDDLVMLTHNLMVTARTGSLLVWDVRLPDPVRIVRLDKGDTGENVRLIRQIGDTIVCSCGSSLRLVRFPILMDKLD